MTNGNDALYRRLLVANTSFIDSRAPAEYAKGAFPNAVSLPLMTDEERAQVGTCYKQQGQEAAIALGHRLVHGAVKEARVAAWQQHLQANPDAWLYCWRGGLRSQLVQQWLSEAGTPVERVPGGYKALRQHILQFLDSQACEQPFVVVSGYTGSGKTLLIAASEHSIDLEGLANHKGSAFGADITPQPTQINFENHLAIALMQRQSTHPLLVEDEGSFIGSCNMPLRFYSHLSSMPCVILDEPMDVRVANLIQTYVSALLQSCQQHQSDDPFAAFEHMLTRSLYRIRKRLGNEAYRQIKGMQEAAIKDTLLTGETALHGAWIAALLERYYDPMYRYQLGQSERAVLFQGNRQAILDWWQSYRLQST
ncbi:tRNA 2-selenouridine(34) synthase MnmH [Alteromonas sp. CYL-A6]|uniref:tRNA 2-selenouridine(34) synthase MnmH n=1 Tax=Alteromonas nitratireducens TaxID=3390813 RepID=UPI0034C1868F